MPPFDSHRLPLWQVHFYRDAYNDAGYGPLPFFERPDPEEVKALLIERFADPMRNHRTANRADVVDDKGEVIFSVATIGDGQARIWMTGPNRAENSGG